MGEQSEALNIRKNDAAINTFCIDCQRCTQAKDGLPFLWIWDIGVLDMAVLMPTTRIDWGLHSFLTHSLRNFVLCSNGCDTGTHGLAGLPHLPEPQSESYIWVKVLKLPEAREGLHFCHHALHMPLWRGSLAQTGLLLPCWFWAHSAVDLPNLMRKMP